MNRDVESKTTFKLLDARQIVKLIRANPAILSAHNIALSKGCFARYILTRVQLKTFTFSSGSQSLSIDNAVIGMVPTRLLFTMIKNKGFLCTVVSNPYQFQHYNITHIIM
jgi:hypothetical protein